MQRRIVIEATVILVLVLYVIAHENKNHQFFTGKENESESRKVEEERHFQITASNVSMNGEGNAITVSPNSTIAIVFDFQLWNRDGCPSCRGQVVVGIDDTAFICIYNGIPGVYPGHRGTATFSMTVPSAPGTYDLIYCGTTQYTCDKAKEMYSTNKGIAQEKQVIGTITVTGNGTIIVRSIQ